MPLRALDLFLQVLGKLWRFAIHFPVSFRDWTKSVQPVVIFLGVIAAIVTLVIYACQVDQLVDQNEKLQTSIDSQAYQGIISTEFQGLLTVLENDELQPIYLEPFGFDVDEMTADERRAHVGAIILFEFFNNIHVQWENEAVSDDLWCPWVKEIDLFLEYFSAMEPTWTVLKGLYNESFKTLVNQRLEEPRPPYPEPCDRILGSPPPRASR